MVVIMKKMIFLSMLTLCFSSLLLQCGESRPNVQYFSKNGKWLTLFSPKEGSSISEQKKYIVEQAKEKNKNNKKNTVLIVNDNTFITEQFQQNYPRDCEAFIKKTINKNEIFTALQEQTKDIILKYNIAFDYFFELEGYTINNTRNLLQDVIQKFTGSDFYNNIYQLWMASFNEDDNPTKLNDLSEDKKQNLSMITKLILNKRYEGAIQFCENNNKNMFICVNADEVSDLQEILNHLGWKPINIESIEQILANLEPKPKSWATFAAIGAGIASCGFLGLVAYKNNWFGWGGKLHKYCISLAIHREWYNFLSQLGVNVTFE